MAPTKLQLLKARISSINSTLRTVSESKKSDHITAQLAENFNKILNDLKTEFPELSNSFPNEIPKKSAFSRMGLVDLKYIDLEILAAQTMAVLDLLESGS